MKKWEYDPGEFPKRKHRWKEDYAGFVPWGRQARIGKCPKSLTNQVAEQILNSGVPFSATPSKDGIPNRIYGVHSGVVYRAVPTRRGVSYHGFPEFPEELRRLPDDVIEAILHLAKKKGCLPQVQSWMNQ